MEVIQLPRGGGKTTQLENYKARVPYPIAPVTGIEDIKEQA